MNSIEEKNILVAMDFRPQALSALNQAISIARILKRQIVLLYVHQEKGVLSSIFSSGQTKLFDEAVLDKLQSLADEQSRQYEVSIVPILKHDNSVHDCIIKQSKESKSELIIMGRGEKGTEQVIGSNTSRVLRNSTVPVITVNKAEVCRQCRKILLPLDLTKETRQKVGWGIQLAKTFHAEIEIFSALWSIDNEEIIKQLKAQLTQTEGFIRKAGVKCSSTMTKASKEAKTLVPIILKHINDNDEIDMVLIMTQQENIISEFFMGSHATELIRKSPVPVMSIVPRETGTIIWGI